MVDFFNLRCYSINAILLEDNMRILFFGDSITDAQRKREEAENISPLGFGFVRSVADELLGEYPNEYEIINKGISGHRVVDLYARVKADVWNLKPDVLNILVGVNDVWHEINYSNGVDIERFERIYRMLIEDTIKALPDTKIILCEPFVLEGSATENTEEKPDRFNRFQQVYEYAKVVKKLAEEFGLSFIPLQEKFTQKAKENGVKCYLFDGVHPHVAGAHLIAKEWLKEFKKLGLEKVK